MPPKPRSKSQAKSSSLYAAIEYCDAILKPVGTIYETHVQLDNNWAMAFNGVLSCGMKIDEELIAYPQSALLLSALSKCNETLSITELDNRLSIKSNKFKAFIPCINKDLAQEIYPDPPIATVNDNFKRGLEIVGILAAEGAQSVVTASILMNGQSLIATDRKVIMEYWHSNDLPPNITLPKAFVAPLVKCKKPLKAFGYSSSSVTFYFEDDSWIKSQTYAETWPDVSDILDRPSNMWSVPAGFFEALKAVGSFSDDGQIYFEGGCLKSHEGDQGASYEVSGVPSGLVYPAKHLALLSGLATKIDFVAPGVHDNSYCLMFVGDAVRGVISGRMKE